MGNDSVVVPIELEAQVAPSSTPNTKPVKNISVLALILALVNVLQAFSAVTQKDRVSVVLFWIALVALFASWCLVSEVIAARHITLTITVLISVSIVMLHAQKIDSGVLAWVAACSAVVTLVVVLLDTFTDV